MRPYAALVAILLVGGPARADILPDPDSADAHCTLAEQCPDGIECPSGVRQDAGVVQACSDAQKAKGLAYRCHRGGNYLGTAVYCRPDAHGSWSPPAPSPPPPAPTPDSAASVPPGGTASPAHGRCAMSPAGGSVALAVPMGSALLGLLLRRRTRGRTA